MMPEKTNGGKSVKFWIKKLFVRSNRKPERNKMIIAHLNGPRFSNQP